MSQALKKSILLLPLMLVVGSYPATAQITATPVSLPERPSGVNSVAFDSVNQVYLVTLAGAGAVIAKFVSKTGAQIGSVFPITVPNEAPYTGWVGVSFGGTATDPAFLVTYVATTGVRCVANKYGRLVRYRAGQALVGGANFITNVGCEWPSAEKAQAAWTGAQFVVGTRVGSIPFPQPEVRTVDLGGGVSGPVIIGDYLDYYGSPAIACASDGVCLVSGYANGIPFGGKGGTYARLINGSTLQPLTDMFYLDDHSSRMENQYVVFNSQTGQFLAAWWRAGFVDTRVVTHEGALLPLRQGVFGGGAAGDLALSYNAGTGKAILISKYVPADLYAVELDANGVLANPNNLVLITRWDGIWPEYTPAIASNGADGQSLAIAVLNSGGRAAIIQSPSGGSTLGDFDGDGRAEIGIWRPTTGEWWLKSSAGGFATYGAYGWGSGGDIPVAGDYDGDRRTDIAVFRPSTGVWYILKSSANFTTQATYTWGGGDTDVPVPGDYDGDHKTDIAVYRSGVWYILNSSTNFTTYGARGWGSSTDVPVPGDYDGDGKTDLAVYRPSLGAWYILTSSSNFTTYTAYTWGAGTDVPVTGDYDGDGRTDIAIFRLSTGVWYILKSSTNFTGAAGYAWGVASDVPAAGDYDGDGKTDIAIYRPGTGTWYILKSSTNFTTYAAYDWGTSGDVPILRRP